MLTIPISQANANIDYIKIYQARSQREEKREIREPIVFKAIPAGIHNLPLEMLIHVPVYKGEKENDTDK